MTEIDKEEWSKLYHSGHEMDHETKTMRKVKHYNIVKRNSDNSHSVVTTAKTRKSAQSTVDRRDMAHGSYAHRAVPVFEETVNEISNTVLNSYKKKAAVDINTQNDIANRLDKENKSDKANDALDKAASRKQGINKANKKMSINTKVTTEQVISELSHKLLKTYAIKAVGEKSRAEGSSEREWDKGHFSASYKASTKAKKRSDGIDMAVKKLKEEETIEEGKTFKDRRSEWNDKKRNNLKNAIKKNIEFRVARQKRIVSEENVEEASKEKLMGYVKTVASSGDKKRAPGFKMALAKVRTANGLEPLSTTIKVPAGK